MYCLYNGEYGEHDLSHIGSLEAILQRQNNSYSKFEGLVVGDFTIVKVEYDWGRKTQVAEVKCNYCNNVKTISGNIASWCKGKGTSRRCECYKNRSSNDKANKPAKPKTVPLSDPSWVGQECSGWRILSYCGDSQFLVECVHCGRTKKVKSYQFKKGTLLKCNHIKINNYLSPEWIGKRVGHLTVVEHKQQHFLAECDCGNRIEVRGTDLFRKKSITTCRDRDCPYYQEQYSKSAVAKRRVNGLSYEHSVRDLFEENGYSIIKTPDCGDYGVDFIVALSGDSKLAIQCKRHNAPSSVRSIQEVYAGGRYYDCTKFAVVSPSGFTANAINMAARLGVYCAIHKFSFEELEEITTHSQRLLDTLPAINVEKRRGSSKIQWTIDGETKTADEWCMQYGVSRGTVSSRVKRGYSIEEAVKLSTKWSRGKVYEVNGDRGTLRQLCEKYDVIPETVMYRMQHRNMSLGQALGIDSKED